MFLLELVAAMVAFYLECITCRALVPNTQSSIHCDDEIVGRPPAESGINILSFPSSIVHMNYERRKIIGLV